MDFRIHAFKLKLCNKDEFQEFVIVITAVCVHILSHQFPGWSWDSTMSLLKWDNRLIWDGEQLWNTPTWEKWLIKVLPPSQQSIWLNALGLSWWEFQTIPEILLQVLHCMGWQTGKYAFLNMHLLLLFFFLEVTAKWSTQLMLLKTLEIAFLQLSHSVDWKHFKQKHYIW